MFTHRTALINKMQELTVNTGKRGVPNSTVFTSLNREGGVGSVYFFAVLFSKVWDYWIGNVFFSYVRKKQFKLLTPALASVRIQLLWIPAVWTCSRISLTDLAVLASVQGFLWLSRISFSTCVSTSAFTSQSLFYAGIPFPACFTLIHLWKTIVGLSVCQWFNLQPC